MRIVWRFLGRKSRIAIYVLDVVALTLGLYNPRWNLWIRDAILVEVEDHLFTLLDFDFHNAEYGYYSEKVKL